MLTRRSILATTLLIATLVVLLPSAALVAGAKPASVTLKGKVYYRVISTNSAQNTGNEVCALVGKTCLGVASIGTNDVCRAFHPRAKSVVGVKGTANGFFCDGTSQKGSACAKLRNTCDVCPTCTASASCSTDIRGQYREMYVECGTLPKNSSSRSSKRSTSQSSRMSSSVSSAPNYPFGPYPGTVACDFYQKAAKAVSCRTPKAGDAFCVSAMKSRSAKAVECADNGRIICTRPCQKNSRDLPLTQCPYDPERRRGYTATPLDFCSFTATSTSAR